MKKLTFVLAVLLLVSSVFTFTSCNSDDSKLLFQEYAAQGMDGYMVTGRGECTDTDIVVPATYKGKPVLGIAEKAFYDCKDITSVTLPDSVFFIESFAFKHCTSLTKINTPVSLTFIGRQAFALCEKLSSFDIPDKIETLSSSAFEGTPLITTEGEDGVVQYVDNWAVGFVDDEKTAIYLESENVNGTVVIKEGTVGIASGLFDEWAENAMAIKRAVGSIVVPKSVKNFAMTGNINYKTIRYEGTVAEWDSVLGKPNTMTSLAIHVTVKCTDGDVKYGVLNQ